MALERELKIICPSEKKNNHLLRLLLKNNPGRAGKGNVSSEGGGIGVYLGFLEVQEGQGKGEFPHGCDSGVVLIPGIPALGFFGNCDRKRVRSREGEFL